MWQDLPTPKRPRKKGQAPQETQVRSHQAHGALSREARTRDQGQERSQGRAKEQARRRRQMSNHSCSHHSVKVVRL